VETKQGLIDTATTALADLDGQAKIDKQTEIDTLTGERDTAMGLRDEADEKRIPLQRNKDRRA